MRTAIDDPLRQRLPPAGRRPDRPATQPPPSLSLTALPSSSALSHIHFPNGGGWCLSCAPAGAAAGRFGFNEAPSPCKGCLEAKGLRYRVEDLSGPERAAHVASADWRALRRRRRVSSRIWPQQARAARPPRAALRRAEYWCRGMISGLKGAMRLPKVPAACADLDLAQVSRVLAKHYGDIPAAARELDVSTRTFAG